MKSGKKTEENEKIRMLKRYHEGLALRAMLTEEANRDELTLLELEELRDEGQKNIEMAEAYLKNIEDREQRLTVKMHYCYGYTLEQIATCMGFSRATAGRRLKDGMEKLPIPHC